VHEGDGAAHCYRATSPPVRPGRRSLCELGATTDVAGDLRTRGGPVSPIAGPTLLKPPVARIRPKIFVEHGRQRIDNYYWLRERDNPEAVAYLEAENAYADARLAPLKPLIDEIRAELTSRAKVMDFNPPFFDSGYYYQRRFTEGSQYQVIVRHIGTLEAPAQVVLDVTSLAAGHAQFHLGRWVVSPEHPLSRPLPQNGVVHKPHRLHRLLVP
jgi:oligopeptidase B